MTLFALSCLALSLYAVHPLFHQFGAGIWSYRLEDVSFYLFLLMLTALHCSLCGIDGRPRRIVPVSYTHLDVYKRQHTAGSKQP